MSLGPLACLYINKVSIFLCKRYNTAIEIIDNTPKSEQEELVEDLVQIITVFFLVNYKGNELTR